MKPIIVCLILSLVVANGWPSRQLDVNSAFLQGTLTDNVFMQQPPGFVNPSTLTMFVTSKRLFMAYVKHHRLGTKPEYLDHVCHLKKAIYGLCQAPQAWYILVTG